MGRTYPLASNIAVMKVTVLGAGSWGTAMAILLARNGHEVRLWGRDAEEIAIMARTSENMRYLPGFALPREIEPVSDAADLGAADLWVVAVPSSGLRDVLPYVVGPSPLIAIASKGLEPGTGDLLIDATHRAIPEARLSVLSGPNLAVEIVRGIPTLAISASASEDTAERVRAAFACRTYRVYVSDDPIGVSLAGALKNVIAIAGGISDGLGYGDNTKGALMARGLREMILFGLALGARVETFLGIAGVGDLFATAVSRLSRNYRVGRALGEGRTLASALEEIGQVAEGVETVEAALIVARQKGVSMPIFEATSGVVKGSLKPLDAVSMLMERLTPTENVQIGA